jgi:hypothetical protein
LAENVATISDVVVVGASVAAVFFPPAATVAAVAEGFSLGARAVSGVLAVGQTVHTGDYSYAGGAALQLVGGGIGAKIGSRVAFGALGRSQLRINGRFGPNAYHAYGRALSYGSGTLGSAVAGVQHATEHVDHCRVGGSHVACNALLVHTGTNRA